MSWSCLRMHAGYRCRHAGVCCRADWGIPAEDHVIRAVELGSIRGTAAARALLAQLEVATEAAVPRHPDRTCMFFEPSPSGSCVLHREVGEGALPSACRHFPRELLIDGRGTLVSLSHYCPTAAALLTSSAALDVINGDSLAIGGELEGLDARGALPPLLRPGVLMDIDGYAAWERTCLAILSRDDLTARQALDEIERLTEAVRRWSPAEGPLATFVVRKRELPRSRRGEARHAGLFAPLVAQHIGPEWLPVADYETSWQPLVEGGAPIERIARNYLGARLFANWIAYQGRGLRTVAEWLRACHAVLVNEMALRVMLDGRTAMEQDALAAAGRADLLLVHTVESQQFADFFRGAEQT